MRLLDIFRKSLLEQVREPWTLVMVLITAPAFLLLYGLFMGGGSSSYNVLLLNEDHGLMQDAGHAFFAGQEIKGAVEGLTYADGQPMLKLRPVSSRVEAEKKLKNRDAVLLVVLPEGFTRALAAGPGRDPAVQAKVTFVGDLTSPGYIVATALIQGILNQIIYEATVGSSPIAMEEKALGISGARTEIEAYIPGIIIISIIMLIFQSSLALAREVEGKTLQRLQLTHMSSFDLLGGISLTQFLLGALAIACAYLTAQVYGFHSLGSPWLALLILLITIFSVIGAGLLVACFARTTSQALVFANFPMMVLMFLSGAAFPIAAMPLFSVAGHGVGVADLLPPTHAIRALNKVWTMGSGLGDVAGELAALAVLSLVYFAAGVWLFRRRHLNSK